MNVDLLHRIGMKRKWLSESHNSAPEPSAPESKTHKLLGWIKKTLTETADNDSLNRVAVRMYLQDLLKEQSDSNSYTTQQFIISSGFRLTKKSNQSITKILEAIKELQKHPTAIKKELQHDKIENLSFKDIDHIVQKFLKNDSMNKAIIFLIAQNVPPPHYVKIKVTVEVNKIKTLYHPTYDPDQPDKCVKGKWFRAKLSHVLPVALEAAAQKQYLEDIRTNWMNSVINDYQSYIANNKGHYREDIPFDNVVAQIRAMGVTLANKNKGSYQEAEGNNLSTNVVGLCSRVTQYAEELPKSCTPQVMDDTLQIIEDSLVALTKTTLRKSVGDGQVHDQQSTKKMVDKSVQHSNNYGFEMVVNGQQSDEKLNLSYLSDVLIFCNEACGCYQVNQPGYLEVSERMGILEYLKKGSYKDDRLYRQSNKAQNEVISLFHSKEYIQRWDKATQQCDQNGMTVSLAKRKRQFPDVFACPGINDAIRYAVGAAIDALDSILGGSCRTAFCCIRPPGHHATINEGMGFCVCNNAGIVAEYAVQDKKLSRVGIVDFDVHHGNGIEERFKTDDKKHFFYGSTHESSIFPFSGIQPGLKLVNEDELKTVRDKNPRLFDLLFDLTIDDLWKTQPRIPQPKEYLHIAGNKNEPPNTDSSLRRIVNRTIDAGFLSQLIFRLKWREILYEMILHSPQLVIICAGFDAHMDDPLGQLKLTAEDFFWATQAVLIACRICSSDSEHVKCFSLLEGGYNLSALFRCVERHLDALFMSQFGFFNQQNQRSMMLQVDTKPVNGSDNDHSENVTGKNGQLILALRCNVCRKTALQSLQCPRCSNAYYCSSACYKSDSPYHQKCSTSTRITRQSTILNQRRGRCQLVNDSVACSFNAILQALSHTFPLVLYLITRKYVEHLNHEVVRDKNSSVNLFAVFMQEMWLSSKLLLDPKAVRRTIGDQYSINGDPSELFLKFLDKLESDFDQKEYLQKLFQTRTEVTHTCTSCSKQTSETLLDYIFQIRVPDEGSYLISNNSISFEDCFTATMSNDEFEKRCDSCPSTTTNSSGTSHITNKCLITLPKILIFAINRYVIDGVNSAIRHINVQFNDTWTPWSNGVRIKKNYQLYAVVTHSGELNGGHYITYSRDWDRLNGQNEMLSDEWYQYDDQQDEFTSYHSFRDFQRDDEDAYLLFYKERDVDDVIDMAKDDESNSPNLKQASSSSTIAPEDLSKDDEAVKSKTSENIWSIGNPFEDDPELELPKVDMPVGIRKYDYDSDKAKQLEFRFPIGPDSNDRIDMNLGNTWRLTNGQWLDDNIINLQIKRFILWKSLQEHEFVSSPNLPWSQRYPRLPHNTCSMYAFPTLFYSAYTEDNPKGSYHLVKTYTKYVDIFSKDIVFIPIHKDKSHWILDCLIRPNLIGSEKEDQNLPCIIHMDSVQREPGYYADIKPALYKYLQCEWDSQRTRSGNKKKIVVINETSVPYVDCSNSIPKQKNGYDCGIYVILYVKSLMKALPPSTQAQIENKFSDVFQQNMFSRKDVLKERRRIKLFCTQMKAKYQTSSYKLVRK